MYSGNACPCLGSNAQSKTWIRHFGNATQKCAVEEATRGTGRLHTHSFSANSVRYATSCAQHEQFQCATRANCFTQTLGATRARREGGHKLNKAVIERRTGSSRWTFGISQLQAHTAVTNLHDNMHCFFIPQLSSFACKRISTSWARSAGSDSSTDEDFSCLEYDAV